METEILAVLETAAIAVSGFLIKKYVFLEPDMEDTVSGHYKWTLREKTGAVGFRSVGSREDGKRFAELVNSRIEVRVMI